MAVLRTSLITLSILTAIMPVSLAIAADPPPAAAAPPSATVDPVKRQKTAVTKTKTAKKAKAVKAAKAPTSVCQGLTKTACQSNTTCGWIEPKGKSKKGVALKPYCRVVSHANAGKTKKTDKPTVEKKAEVKTPPAQATAPPAPSVKPPPAATQ